MRKLHLLKFRNEQNEETTNAQPQPASAPATQPAITPTINTAGLKNELNATKAQAPLLAQRFNLDHGFLPTILSIITVLQGLWVRFEESAACAVLVKASHGLSKAMREYRADELVAAFNSTVDEWNAWIREGMRQAIGRKLERQRERVQKLAELAQRKLANAQQQFFHELRMTGGGTSVTPVNYSNFALSILITFMLMCAIEGAGGYDMFEFSGTSIGAVAWSLINVILLTGLSALESFYRAQICAYNDALIAFAQNYPNPIQDLDGRVIQVYPLPSRVYLIANFCRKALIFWSIGLFGYRLTMAIWNSEEYGWNAVFGAAGMVMLAWVYNVYEVSRAPRFPREHQDKWQKYVDTDKQIDADIESYSVDGSDPAYTEELNGLIAQYNQAIAGAKQYGREQAQNLRNLATTYLELVSQYEAAFVMVRRWFHSFVQEVANRIITPDRRVLDNPDDLRQAEESFKRTVVMSLKDEPLENEARAFRPDFNPPEPSAVITNFGPLETELTVQLETAAAATNLPGPSPLMNWPTA